MCQHNNIMLSQCNPPNNYVALYKLFIVDSTKELPGMLCRDKQLCWSSPEYNNYYTTFIVCFFPDPQMLSAASPHTPSHLILVKITVVFSYIIDTDSDACKCFMYIQLLCVPHKLYV